MNESDKRRNRLRVKRRTLLTEWCADQGSLSEAGLCALLRAELKAGEADRNALAELRAEVAMQAVTTERCWDCAGMGCDTCGGAGVPARAG